MSTKDAIREAVERYLRLGEYEHDHPEWPGQNIFEKARNGHDDLLRSLVAGVRKRSAGRSHHAVPDLHLTSWTRRKLTPMVHGFFPEAEREAVLRLFEKSVVFLTRDNIEAVLLGQTWLHSAWDLANLYLSSVKADLLGPEAPSLLGLSQETTCYVSTEYFAERGKIEDFVIHEAAHVFHNCKRKTAGLPETTVGPRSGSSFWSSASARPSPTPARRSAGSSNGLPARPNASPSPKGSPPAASGSATTPRTRKRWRTSSRRRARLATGGRSSWPDAPPKSAPRGDQAPWPG